MEKKTVYYDDIFKLLEKYGIEQDKHIYFLNDLENLFDYNLKILPF